MQVMPENEGIGVANDSGGLEFGCDAASGVARMEQHELLAGWRHRKHECPGEPASGGEDGEQ